MLCVCGLAGSSQTPRLLPRAWTRRSGAETPSPAQLVARLAVPKAGGRLSWALSSGTCRIGSIPRRTQGESLVPAQPGA